MNLHPARVHDEIAEALAVKREVYIALGLDPARIYDAPAEDAPELEADDAQTIADTIDGATSIRAIIEALIIARNERTFMQNTIDAHIRDLGDRKKRVARKEHLILGALMKAMTAGGMPKAETAAGTASIMKGSTSVGYLPGREKDIPPEFTRVLPPVPDGVAILAALRKGEDVPGCSLVTGAPRVQIRVR